MMITIYIYIYIYIYIFIFSHGVRLSPLGTMADVWPIVPALVVDDDDDDDCGLIDGVRIGRGSRSTRRKPAPVPLCL
jgi:hypothetical protein